MNNMMDGDLNNDDLKTEQTEGYYNRNDLENEIMNSNLGEARDNNINNLISQRISRMEFGNDSNRQRFVIK